LVADLPGPEIAKCPRGEVVRKRIMASPEREAGRLIMDWERIDPTVRQAARKRGSGGQYHDIVEPSRARTPLSDLIAKDPKPDMDAMTEPQLCEYAADHHIAIPEGLSRDELIELIRESLTVNWEERLLGMRKMLDYFYQDGPHPVMVYRRLVAVTKAISPAHLLNMSCAQLAILSDDGKGDRGTDGRATVSERIQRLFEEPIKRAGMRGHKAPFQKTATACDTYSVAAQENQNRHGREYLEAARNGANKRTKAA
jgi:hypothetical protein